MSGRYQGVTVIVASPRSKVHFHAIWLGHFGMLLRCALATPNYASPPSTSSYDKPRRGGGSGAELAIPRIAKPLRAYISRSRAPENACSRGGPQSTNRA